MIAYKHSAFPRKLQESHDSSHPSMPKVKKSDLVRACYNMPQVADLLQYFLIAAWYEQQRPGSCSSSSGNPSPADHHLPASEELADPAPLTHAGEEGKIVPLPSSLQHSPLQHSPFQQLPGDGAQNVASLQHFDSHESAPGASSSVVLVQRTHQQILKKLPHPPSRKSLIKYLDLLHSWGYVLNERYQRVYRVNFPAILHAIEQPPEPDQERQKVVTLQHSRKVTTSSTGACSASCACHQEVGELQQKVVTLQQNVVELQQKVVTLQLFYEERITQLTALVERLEGCLKNAFPSISNNSNSNRNKRNKNMVSSPYGEEEISVFSLASDPVTGSEPVTEPDPPTLFPKIPASQTEDSRLENMPPVPRAQTLAAPAGGKPCEKARTSARSARKTPASSSLLRQQEGTAAAAHSLGDLPPEPQPCSVTDPEGRKQALDAYQESCRLYWKSLPTAQRPVRTWQDFWRRQRARWEQLNPRPKREKELCQLLQEHINQWRGMPLQEPQQIIKERRAIQTLAQGLLRYEQGDREQGYSLEELRQVWERVIKDDPFWSKNGTRQIAGAVAIAQRLLVYLPLVRGKQGPQEEERLYVPWYREKKMSPTERQMLLDHQRQVREALERKAREDRERREREEQAQRQEQLHQQAGDGSGSVQQPSQPLSFEERIRLALEWRKQQEQQRSLPHEGADR